LLSWCRAWFQAQKPLSHRRHVAVDEQAVHTVPHRLQYYAAEKPRFVDLRQFVRPLVLASWAQEPMLCNIVRVTKKGQHSTPLLFVDGNNAG